ncbi:helix-turn-helix domain-containing protein [Halorussus halophilus]|uniref:helix-turn-helix domain-containing protein n=1 Tax=Halorussus halophilus TaxID=2650975 RepID=UPI0013018DF9|nr:helix-turn-helix domain-containing protein [Halorussus halophilus]
MLRAKIYFDLDRECVLSELTRQWNRPFTVTQEKVHDDELITLVIDTGDQRDRFERRLRESSQVEHVEVVDETHLLLTKRSCGALPVIRSNHGMLWGMDKVNGSQRVFDVVVFRREDLKAIVAGLRDIGSVSLGRLTPYYDRTATLSPRQAEIVETALDEGYFDWPRRIDAEELAERFDIAHSTLLEHLRKAEKKLLEEALSDERTPDSSTPDERAFMLREAT